MKKLTKELLEESGYEIENAQIESVRLTMADHGVLTSDLVLNGHGWGVCYGGYVLGKGHLGSKDFEGYGSGMEAIMRIMDTVGVEEYGQMKGKYVRVATKGLGSSVRIIGNVLDDIMEMERDDKNKIQKSWGVRGGKKLKVTFELSADEERSDE